MSDAETTCITMNVDIPTPPNGLEDRAATAKFLSISLRKLDDLTKRGLIPFYKIGKSVRFDPVEVKAALRARYHVNEVKPVSK